MGDSPHQVIHQEAVTTSGAGDRLQSLAQAVDLNRQVQEHPWLVVGGSVALGFLAAQLLKENLHPGTASQETAAKQRVQASESEQQESASSETSLGGLTTWLGQQLDEVKGFASSAIRNYAHALLARGLDSLQDQLGQHGRSDEGRGSPRPDQVTDPPQGTKYYVNFAG